MVSEQDRTGWMTRQLRNVGLAAALAVGMVMPAWADSPPTLAELQGRAQIEDLLVDYYGHLGPGGGNFGDFYVEDGVLDVNGDIARGQNAIEDLYRRLAAGTPRREGTFRMLLTNPRISVKGDTATADMIWTGVLNVTLNGPPQFAEQGREHDELVRRNGRWLFKYRAITADSGMPHMFDKTYKKR